MAWTFNTWSEWTDTLGRNWRVVVAAGALAVGGGSLYWWQRDEPRYPAAQDEAVSLAATAERMMVVGDTSLLIPVFEGETNAVRHYPSFTVITNCAKAIVAVLEPKNTWTAPEVGTVGDVWVDGNPSSGFLDDPESFADDRVSWAHFWTNTIHEAWWTNNICTQAWVYAFQTNWYSIIQAHDEVEPVYVREDCAGNVYVCSRDPPHVPAHYWGFCSPPFRQLYCYHGYDITNTIPAVTNWWRRVPYVRTNYYGELAKTLSAMQVRASRGTVVAYTNYTKYGIGLDYDTYEDALDAAWASAIGNSINTTDDYGPMEGVLLQYFAPQYPDYKWDVTLTILATDIVFGEHSTLVNFEGSNFNSWCTISVDGMRDTWMPGSWVERYAFVTNGIGEVTNVPFCVGGHVGTNRPTFFRPASSLDSWNYLAETYSPPYDPYYVYYGWGWSVMGPTYGEGGWWRVMLTTKYDFTHLTNAITFWP